MQGSHRGLSPGHPSLTPTERGYSIPVDPNYLWHKTFNDRQTSIACQYEPDEHGDHDQARVVVRGSMHEAHRALVTDRLASITIA